MQVRIPVFSASFFPVCRISEFSWLYITKKYFFVVYFVNEELLMKEKRIKVILVLSLILMLLCGIFVSAIQTGGGKISMKELNIETDEGYSMSAYLLVPDSATADTPAPAIVTSHGYLNNMEIMRIFTEAAMWV